MARAARVAPGDVTFIYAPTQSLAGSTQVVARVLEVALHKAHAVGFDLGAIVDGIGAAPLSPPHPDFVQAMGRTNDAIIYGGRVQLFVEADDADARGLAEALPSTTSRDTRRPLRRDLRPVQRRLLRHRLAPVQPGRGGGDLPAHRYQPPRRPAGAELVARSFG